MPHEGRTAAKFCEFEEIQVEQGRLGPKVLRGSDASAEWQLNRLYLGGGKFVVKARDIVDVQIKERSVLIKTANKTIHLKEAHRTRSNDRPWGMLVKRLSASYAKFHPDATAEFSTFLKSSSKVALGKQPRRDMSPSPKLSRRRTFGKHRSLPKKILTPMPWDDEVDDTDNDANMDFHTTSTVAEQAESIMVTEPADTPTPSDWRNQSSGRKGNMQNKRKHSGFEDTDSSEGEQLSSGATYTTPATQIVVSPSRTTASRRLGNKSEDDQPTIDKGQKTLSSFFSQKSPRSFDPSKNCSDAAATTKAVDKFSAVDSPKTTTPKTPERNLNVMARTPNSRLIVMSSKHERRTPLEQKDDWLTQSPARSVSALRRREVALLGSSSPAMKELSSDPIALLGSSSPAMNELSSDPIEDDDDRQVSTPRSPSKIPYTYNYRFQRAQFNRGRRVHARPGFSVPRWDLPSVSEAPDVRRNQLRGLRNLGNTCYISASLQMICTLRDTIGALQPDMGKLSTSVVQVAQELAADRRQESTSVSPHAVKDAIDEKTDKFIGYEQRDAHEFMSDLVDLLHEEQCGKQMGNTTEKEDPAANEEPTEKDEMDDKAPKFSPMDDFLCTLRTHLRCLACGYERFKDEAYRHLSIDIIEDVATEPQEQKTLASLEKGLEHFFQPEVREIKCEKCSDGTHASQTLEIVNRYDMTRASFVPSYSTHLPACSSTARKHCCCI